MFKYKCLHTIGGKTEFPITQRPTRALKAPNSLCISWILIIWIGLFRNFTDLHPYSKISLNEGFTSLHGLEKLFKFCEKTFTICVRVFHSVDQIFFD